VWLAWRLVALAAAHRRAASLGGSSAARGGVSASTARRSCRSAAALSASALGAQLEALLSLSSSSKHAHRRLVGVMALIVGAVGGAAARS